MALVNCPECGKEVSSLAEACPNCGCPGKYFPGGRLRTGDSYMFGNWGGEDIEWRVLDVEGGRALLITERAIDCKPYNNEQVDITWKDCPLRAWLNGEFLYGAFTYSQRGQIAETSVVNENSWDFYTKGGPDTKDRIFCLSTEEAYRYFADGDSRICYPTQCAKDHGVSTSSSGACFWWLRSPSYGGGGAAAVGGGEVPVFFYGELLGVRPALWLDL